MSCKFLAVSVFTIGAALLGSVHASAQHKVAGAIDARRQPTPVIEVNEAAKKPIAYWTKLYFPESMPKPGEPPVAEYKESEDFFVPDGMTLVLDYANTVACFGPAEKMSIGVKTGYGENRTPANLKILLTEQGVFNEPDGVYLHAGSSQQMKIYIRGGEAFRLTAWRSGAPEHAEVEFWISGYLMPAPALRARGQ
jgi:hypothetical protein